MKKIFIKIIQSLLFLCVCIYQVLLKDCKYRYESETFRSKKQQEDINVRFK